MTEVTLRDSTISGLAALRLEGGGVAAVLVPSLGGRIAALLVDGLDLFWRDPRLGAEMEARAALPRPVYWGGWKSWIAPQSRWPDGLPPRDLDEGAYEVVVSRESLGGPSVRMTSPVCRETGLQIAREVTVDAATRTLSVRVELTNRGAAPLESGIWEVIQLRKPALVTLPVDPSALSPEEGGVRTYLEEADSRAARAKHVRVLSDASGRRVEVRCTGDMRYKFGARAPIGRGWIRAKMGQVGRALKLRYDAPEGARYAHRASAEVFSSDIADYFEIEAHAPLTVLEPGGPPVAHAFRLEAAPTKRSPERMSGS